MKLLLAFLTVALICVFEINCFKLIDADSYYLPAIYNEKRARARDYHHKQQQQQLPDLLYSPNYGNAQGSLYDDSEDLSSFQKVLEALAENEALSSQENSIEFDDSLSLPDALENSNKNKYYYIDEKADPRDEESESHSSLVAGHQYVSGGAGEGKQHLQPDGHIPNIEEVKTDEDLPAYCDPPNPCPIGYVGEDCDPRPYSDYTAEYSKTYQDQQNCMCDDDHNECQQKTIKSKSLDNKVNDLIKSMNSMKQDDKILSVVAKKSPRIRRDLSSQKHLKIAKNPYLRGEAINIVAKKSSA